MHRSRILRVFFLAFLALGALNYSWAVPPADISFESAVQFLKIGNDQRAVEAFQEFLNTYPADARAMQASFLLGCGYQNLQKFDRALPLFAQVVAKSTDEELRANAHYQAAECHRSVKAPQSFEQAALAYGAFLTIAERLDLTGKDEATRQRWQSRIVNAYYWRAESLTQMGNDVDALAAYHQVLRIAPNDPLAPWASYAIGFMHYKQGRFVEAVANLQRINTDYKDSEVAGEANFTLGLAYAGLARSAAEPAAREQARNNALGILQAVIADGKVTVTTRQQAYLTIAQLEQESGETDKALTAMAQAIQVGDAQQRVTVEARLHYAHMLVNASRYEDADHEYAQVAEQKLFSDLAAEALFWRGISYFKQAGKTRDAALYRKAIASLQQYVTQAPKENSLAAEATLVQAFCYEDMAHAGDKEAQAQALATFKKIQEQWPNSDQSVQARDGIARLMHSMTPDQLRVLIGQLPAGMTNWDVALQLAFAEYNAGRYAGVLDAANEALKGNPTPEVRAQAHYLIGAAQYKSGKLPEAIAAFQQVFAIAPASELAPYARRALLQSYLDSNQFQAAVTTAQALQNDRLTATGAEELEEKAERLILLAAAYQGNQQRPQAIETYQLVIDQYAKTRWAATALMNAAWIAITQNDPATAIKHYEQLVTAYPTHELAPDAYRQWGVLLTEQKQYAAAIDIFKRVPPEATIAAQAAFDIGWALLKLEQLDEATAQFLRVTEQYPASPLAVDSFSQLGELAFQRRDFENAVLYFGKAAASAGNDEDAAAIYYHLGVSAYNASEYRIGADAFDKVVDKYPTFKYAADSAFWKSECLALLGAVQAANARLGYQLYLQRYDTEKFAPNAAAGMVRASMALKQYPAARTDIANAAKIFTAFENSTEQGMAARVRTLAAEMQYLHGVSFFEEKNYQQALTEFVAVAAYGRRGDWYHQSLLHTARCYAILNDKVSATSTLRELLNTAPNSDAARQAPEVAREYGLPL